jgi:hypothetical protein
MVVADPLSFGLTLALTAAQMALTMTRKIEGPRLNDLKVSVADFGTPMNYFYGLRRFQGNPIFFAEDIREEKHHRKGKGGKYNDYTYFGTFGVLVADHQIDAVTRIWADKHLIYDVTGAGPVMPLANINGFISVGLKILGLSPLNHCRIYLGTEDQEADPRMLATIEAKFGPGSCPAYRGVSYVMFEDVPLEKVGNRIPQISIEAASHATPAYPYNTYAGQPPGLARLFGFTFSSDYSRFVSFESGQYEIWDVAARTKMIGGTIMPVVTGHPAGIGLANDGTLYMAGTTGMLTYGIYQIPADGVGPGTVLFNTFPEQNGCVVRQDGLGNEWLFTHPYAFYRTWYSLNLSTPSGGAVAHTSDSETGHAYQPQSFFTDGYGDIWLVGLLVGPFVNATTCYFQRVVDTGARPGSPGFAAIGMPGAGPDGTCTAVHDLKDKQFVLLWNNGALYALDDETFAIKASRAISTDIYNSGAQFGNLPPGSRTIWLNRSEISLSDLSTVRTVDFHDWAPADPDADGIIYDPINHALIAGPQLSDTVTWFYLDRVSSDGVTLGSIISDVAIRSGIDPSAIDTTDCDQLVKGWSWTQGSGKSILEPLCDAYDSILRPHNFGLEALKRGAASGGTIDVAQFVRQNDKRYVVARTLETDLPRRVYFNFADTAADQQPNSVPSQRSASAVDGKRELSIDMTTLALDIDSARSLADRVFRRRWFGRVAVNNALSAQYLAIEPGDVRTLNLDGESFTGIARRWIYGADGVIAMEWERDDPVVASLSGAAGAPFDGRSPSVIPVPLISKGFALDIPLLRDSDSSANPLIYYGAAPYAAGTWPGAIFYESLDDGGEYSTERGNVPSTAPSSWGYATDVLDDADPWLWDRGNSINVKLQYGTLINTTEAVCNATPTANLALLGSELIQFTTATLQGDGSYTLTGLKRGRRGTEWACGSHAAGEQFVLLNQINHFQMGASDIGTNLLFKAVTVGGAEGGTFPIGVKPYSGASLKPYAPAGVTAEKDSGTGDWTIDWTRRSRIGGAWTSGTSVPLGEASEQYEVDILSGSSVVRTISGLTSPTATYSETDQVADGGDVAEGSLDIKVYQLSDVAGRGFAREALF